MGILGLGKKKHRGVSRTGTERLAAEKAGEQRIYNKWLRGLQERSDPLFAELMMQRHGVPTDNRDQVSNFLKSLKAFREAKVIEDPDSSEIAQLGKQVAPFIKALLPREATSGQAPIVQVQVPLGYKLVPIDPQPQAGTDFPPVSLEQQATAAVGPVEVSPLSQEIIDRFGSVTPEQAAGSFLATPAPFVNHFAGLLCTTPDAQLDDLLLQLSGQVPDLAGLFAWLRARPDWLLAFTQAVRRAKGTPLVVSGTPGRAA